MANNRRVPIRQGITKPAFQFSILVLIPTKADEIAHTPIISFKTDFYIGVGKIKSMLRTFTADNLKLISFVLSIPYVKCLVVG